MKKLLVTRNRQKSTEQGFSIAVSTGFGLIIMMIGLTLMGRALKDSSVSASQKTISRSDAAAQVGSTRLLSLIAKYPQLAGVNDCDGTRSSSDNSCPDASTTTSWKNLGNISNLTVASSDSTRLDAIRSGQWVDIDSTKPEKGQFRLTKYTPSTSGPGNIEMAGRVGQNGTGNTATNDIQTGSAKSDAEIYFTAAQEGQVEKINGAAFPGIWLSHPKSVTQIFVANGLLENLAGNDEGTKKLYAHPDATIAAAKIPDGPADVNTTSLSIANFRPAKPTTFVATLPDSSVTLPRPGDLPSKTQTINGVPTQIYEYSFPQTITQDVFVNTVNSSGSGTGNAKKVIIYLDGDIDPQGNNEITHTCKDRAGAPVASGSCNLSNFQIYGYKPYSSTAIPKICLHGKHRVEAFIIAPGYTAGLKGGAKGKGGIHGALWARSWGEGGSTCNSSSEHPGVQQTGTAWTEVSSYFPTQTPALTITAETPATPAKVGLRPTPTVSP
jgi:hypothetical protein